MTPAAAITAATDGSAWAVARGQAAPLVLSVNRRSPDDPPDRSAAPGTRLEPDPDVTGGLPPAPLHRPLQLAASSSERATEPGAIDQIPGRACRG